MTFMSCRPFFRCQKFPSLLPSDFFLKKQSHFVLKFCHVMSFYALHVSSEQMYYAFAEKLDEYFWARLKEKVFAFMRN